MTGASAANAPTLADPLEQDAAADASLGHVADELALEVDGRAVVAVGHGRDLLAATGPAARGRAPRPAASATATSLPTGRRGAGLGDEHGDRRARPACGRGTGQLLPR